MTLWDNDVQWKLSRVEAILSRIFKLDEKLDQLFSLNARFHTETAAEEATLKMIKAQIVTSNSAPEDLRSHFDQANES